MFFFVLTKRKETFKMDIFRKERRKKKSTHRETTKFCFLVCESKKKRVERLNPKRQRQNFLSLEDKTKKKKAKRNQEHQTHTHTYRVG